MNEKDPDGCEEAVLPDPNGLTDGLTGWETRRRVDRGDQGPDRSENRVIVPWLSGHEQKSEAEERQCPSVQSS